MLRDQSSASDGGFVRRVDRSWICSHCGCIVVSDLTNGLFAQAGADWLHDTAVPLAARVGSQRVFEIGFSLPRELGECTRATTDAIRAVAARAAQCHCRR